MSGFYNTQTFKETYHHKSDISRESGTKWETEDLAISHGRKLPGCVGLSYNHHTKSAYFHNKIHEGNIMNSNNTGGTNKWGWHSLTIFEQRGATNFSPEPEPEPEPVPASKEKVSRKDGGGDTASISEDDQEVLDLMIKHGAKERLPSNRKEYCDIHKAGRKGATYFHSAEEAIKFMCEEKNWKKHHNCAIVLRKNQVKGPNFGKLMWGIRKATLAKFHDEDDEKVIDAPYTQGGTLWCGWGFKSDEYAGVKSNQEVRDDFKEFVDMINGAELEEEKSQKITQKKELWGGKEGEYW